MLLSVVDNWGRLQSCMNDEGSPQQNDNAVGMGKPVVSKGLFPTTMMRSQFLACAPALCGFNRLIALQSEDAS